MPRNVEIKARVPDLTPVRDRLRALGAGEPEHLQQRDTYFRSQTGRYKLREHPGGSAELIHYQRSDLDEPALSSYTLVPTQTPGSVRRSFTSLLGVRGEVVKRREVYHLDRTRVHLDLVEGLGTFVELEVVLAPGEAVAVGGAEVYRVLDVLGLVEAELIAASYIDLVEAKGPTG
jgi:predicted adenylyl cyclase CyaB